MSADSFHPKSNGIAHKPWSSFMRDAYASRKPPVLGTVGVADIEQAAREKLKDHPSAFMYVFGSAGTNNTYAANRTELDKWRIVPRMLVDATVRNIETTIFGVKHRSPLLLAPIGVQGIVHADAECAAAAAAATLDVPFIMSTASTRSIEAVAKANGSGHRWYQLYWPKSDDITLSILSRAKANGFTALVVTLDTMLLGWRPHDLQTAYLPFIHGVGAQVGLTDPVFMAHHGAEPISDTDVPEFPYDPVSKDKAFFDDDEKIRRTMYLGNEWLKETNSGQFKTWADLKFLRDNWEGPIILKGIQSVKDAELAIEHNMDGIVVSNHGGRQIDGALPALYALRQICTSPTIKAAQESGKLTILYDSGIRTGSDIYKALAIGAQGVLLARPFMYGLALAGEAGVEQVIRGILADLEITLGLAGFRNIQEIQGKADEILVRLD